MQYEPDRRLEVFCDFDGTITSQDTIMFLTDHFGGGNDFREDIGRRIRSGELPVYDAIRQELASVRLSWEQARQALDREIDVDPFFGRFVLWCRDHALSLTVVSSGISRVVEHYVGKFGVRFHGHPVEMGTKSGWQYRVDSRHVKARVLAQAARRADIIFIGDGASDIEAIPYASRLYAKHYLAEFCRLNGHEYQPFESFEDIRIDLARWLRA